MKNIISGLTNSCQMVISIKTEMLPSLNVTQKQIVGIQKGTSMKNQTVTSVFILQEDVVVKVLNNKQNN